MKPSFFSCLLIASIVILNTSCSYNYFAPVRKSKIHLSEWSTLKTGDHISITMVDNSRIDGTVKKIQPDSLFLTVEGKISVHRIHIEKGSIRQIEKRSSNPLFTLLLIAIMIGTIDLIFILNGPPGFPPG